MQDRIADIESRLAAVEQRLSALEGVASAEAALDQTGPVPTLGEGFIGNASAHIGRVLLIFGGAYLLRAITDSQFVPTGFGITLGAVYALFWLVMAYRQSGVAARRAAAAFYGGTSILLALPLIVEATTKFELLSGRQGIIAIAVYSTLALTTAATRKLLTLAWLTTAGGIGAAFAVLIASRAAAPAAALLLLLGIGTLWVVYWRHWTGPQWLGAIGANAGVLALAVLSGSEQWQLQPSVAAPFAAILLLAYLLSFAVRTHVLGKDIAVFEPAQALLAIGIAFWVARVVVEAGQLNMMYAGMLGLVLGGIAYALAFAPQTRARRGANYYFFSALGLLLVVAGSAAIMSGSMAAALWSLLALAMAWFSGRTGRVSLSLQCTILLVAAGIGSGILTTGVVALAGDPANAWPAMRVVYTGVALTTVVCLFLPVAQRSERWGVLAGLPQLTVLALSVWEVGGLIVVALAPLLAAAGAAQPNTSILAALRTAVLSASSVTLALSSRFKRWPEARWLVYPVLMLVGIKLFAEDFPNGQPASLFVALVFVGGALLVVAKLLRRGDLEI